MRRWPSVVLTLGKRRRRWPNVKTTLGEVKPLNCANTKPTSLAWDFHVAYKIVSEPPSTLCGPGFNSTPESLVAILKQPVSTCWLNAEPTLQTVAQHQANIWSISRRLVRRSMQPKVTVFSRVFCSNSLILKIHLKEPPLRMNYKLLIYNICVRLKIRTVYYRMYMSPSLSWLSGYSHLPCNSHHGHSNIILEQILPVWLYYYYIYIIIIIIVGMVIWYRPTIYGLDYTISHSMRYYIYAHNVTA